MLRQERNIAPNIELNVVPLASRLSRSDKLLARTTVANRQSYLRIPAGRVLPPDCSLAKLVEACVLNSPPTIVFMLRTRYNFLLQRTLRKPSRLQERRTGGLAQIIKEDSTQLPRLPMW